MPRELQNKETNKKKMRNEKSISSLTFDASKEKALLIEVCTRETAKSFLRLKGVDSR